MPDFLGIGVDEKSQRYVGLVDRDLANDDTLGAIARDVVEMRPKVPLRLQPSCRSRKKLERTKSALERFSPESPLAFYLEQETGQFVVSVNPAQRRLIAKLKRRFKSAVRVEEISFGQHDRETDGEPHYGAAAIANGAYGPCTAGFVVDGALVVVPLQQGTAPLVLERRFTRDQISTRSTTMAKPKAFQPIATHGTWST